MEQPQEKPAANANHVLQTPLWIMIIRGLQFLISLVILGLCARLMHDATMSATAFSLAVVIISWVVIVYAVVTEKVPSLRSAYHIIAVLCLDGFLIVLWLAAWAYTASQRAKYVVSVNVGDCYDDGSFADSKTCSIYKRADENVILFKSGLAMLAAIAGLGALVWLLFIVTFAWTLVMFIRGRREGRFAVDTSALTTPSNNYQMETKVNEAQPVTQTQPQQGPPVPQYQQQPAPGQFDPQQQQGQYPPQNAPTPYQQPQSPYQPQGAYPPPQGAPYSPHEQQFQGQQNYGQYPPQTYGSELSASSPPPVATSPPPHQPYSPQQQYQQPPQVYGSELSGSTPPPGTTSPPPHQPYPPQAYPQQ